MGAGVSCSPGVMCQCNIVTLCHGGSPPKSRLPGSEFLFLLPLPPPSHVISCAGLIQGYILNTELGNQFPIIAAVMSYHSMSGLSIFTWPRQRQQMCAGGPLIVAIAEQINNTKQTWDGSHWLISRQTCVVLRFAEQWVLMAPPLATHYYTSPDIAVIDDRVASHWPRGRGRGASPSYYPLPSCLQSQGWPCLMWFTVLGIILWTPLPSIMTIALLLLRPSYPINDWCYEWDYG